MLEKIVLLEKGGEINTENMSTPKARVKKNRSISEHLYLALNEKKRKSPFTRGVQKTVKPNSLPSLPKHWGCPRTSGNSARLWLRCGPAISLKWFWTPNHWQQCSWYTFFFANGEWGNGRLWSGQIEIQLQSAVSENSVVFSAHVISWSLMQRYSNDLSLISVKEYYSWLDLWGKVAEWKFVQHVQSH